MKADSWKLCLACCIAPFALSVAAQTQTNTFPATGNVGIGTNQPPALLTVNQGTLQLTGTSQVPPTTGYGMEMFYDGTRNYIMGYNRSSPAYLPLELRGLTINLNGNNSNKGIGVYVNSSNNVGIGTSSPTDRLHIVGGGAGQLTDEFRIGTNGGTPNTSVRMRFVAGEDSQPTEIGNIRSVLTVGLSGGSYMGLGGQGQIDTMVLTSNGAVGIGTTAPGALFSVGSLSQFTVNSLGNVTTPSVTTPSLIFPGSNAGPQTTPWTGVLCGGDYAEAVDPAGDLKSYAPGDVLVIADGAEDVRKSSEPYATTVAGIYATKPGVVGRRESLPKDGSDFPMAMVGIVPTKVTAENGPIHKGDLLVSSSRPGYAMKGTDRSRMLGAVIGKAMRALDSGDGVIDVLVTLQ